MQLVFWFAATTLLYAFVGYPVLMRTLARYLNRQPNSILRPSKPIQSASIIVAAHNESKNIQTRISNLIESEFNGTAWEIIVVSDGSTDDTAGKARKANHPNVHVLEFENKQGKAACINAGVAAAKHEILIFTDARQRFAKDTVTELLNSFLDPEVVGAGGELHIAASKPGSLSELGTYWKLERKLRDYEAKLWSTVGCSGAIYAIRSEEFKPIPHDTILDDVIIPMQATLNGGRILFNKAARAFDPQPLNSDRERMRKQRTLGGNFQLLFRYHQWLTPWGHPLWWQLISHKHLRIFSPVLLLACAISNITLLGSHSIYLVTGILQFAVYATGLLGLCPKISKLRPFSTIVAFLFLNAMTVGGFYYYLTSSRKPGWS